MNSTDKKMLVQAARQIGKTGVVSSAQSLIPRLVQLIDEQDAEIKDLKGHVVRLRELASPVDDIYYD